MSFCVEFPFPREGERRLIWEKIWPSQAPRRADLPLERMANRFEISGGNIKNIALAAAFLAAHDGGEIATRHLLRAIRREYQKMGKILEDDDFREQMDE
jgi:ATP-dependent 26S proteasome regulatory subunit